MKARLPLAALLAAASLEGQMLLVDRPAAKPEGVRIGRPEAAGFVGDHFQFGAAGEIWVIDAIRTWAIPPVAGSRPADLYSKIVLLGGIEAPPPKPGEPDCDCHNLPPLKTANLTTAGPDTREVEITSAAAGLWQVDFRRLNWSVPGGVEIQFGVLAAGRGEAREWWNYAAPASQAHRFRLFDEAGKLEGPYPAGEPLALAVQVWGHKLAPVEIRPSTGSFVDVVVHSTGSFDAGEADVASLRFGPLQAAAQSSRPERNNGKPQVVARFRRADTGLAPNSVNACLSGRLKDGVPFEGCDLIKTVK